MLRRCYFNLRAKTRHGTHSPFIYAFLDQALYAKRRSNSPSMQLLLSTADHFRPARTGVLDADMRFRELQALRPNLAKGPPPYDLGIAGRPGPELLSWIREKAYWHNDSVVFVGGIRESREARRYWKEACATEGVRQCLETYGAGLLFFRREQAAEHFKIRL